MRFDWQPEYVALASQFLAHHFGGAQGLTNCFPCMRDDYPWGDHRPQVLDSRVPAKNNTEYHGLERHAKQYHATAQYNFAYHHWLIAAYWRWQDMKANNFTDQEHNETLRYAIKQAQYNRALNEWQENPRNSNVPKPEDFELDSTNIDKQEKKALEEIENYVYRKQET